MANSFVDFLSVDGVSMSAMREECQVIEEDSTVDVVFSKASTPRTVMAFLKAFVASGILFIPKGFNNGGILYSNLLIVAVSILATIAMRLLLITKQRIVTDTQQDPLKLDFGGIAEAACGKAGRVAVNTCIIASQLGFCTVYLAFVGTTMNDLLPSVSAPWWMLAGFGACLPLSLLHRMSSLTLTNVVALMIIVFTICVCIACSTEALVAPPMPAPTVIWSINTERCMIFFGTAVYTFEGIAMVLPLEMNMERPEDMPSVVTGCMIAITVMIGGFGTVCYLAYGAAVETIILHNLGDACTSDSCALFAKIVQGMYTFVIVATFPLMMFPVRLISEQYLCASVSTAPQHSWQHYMWRSLLCVLSLGISIVAASNLSNFVAIIGAVCCCPIAFLFPGLFHLRVCHYQAHIEYEPNEGSAFAMMEVTAASQEELTASAESCGTIDSEGLIDNEGLIKGPAVTEAAPGCSWMFYAADAILIVSGIVMGAVSFYTAIVYW